MVASCIVWNHCYAFNIMFRWLISQPHETTIKVGRLYISDVIITLRHIKLKYLLRFTDHKLLSKHLVSKMFCEIMKIYILYYLSDILVVYSSVPNNNQRGLYLRYESSMIQLFEDYIWIFWFIVFWTQKDRRNIIFKMIHNNVTKLDGVPYAICTF